jgi:hypothetical protein
MLKRLLEAVRGGKSQMLVLAGEWGIGSDVVAVRDTADRHGPALIFSAAPWRQLAETLR